MSGILIVGAQWGDEGKGKLVDALAEKADVVARFGGGNNAGHTLVVNGIKTKLSLVPSGILRPHTLCLVGAGVVLNASVFGAELEALEKAGIHYHGRLFIDERATLVLPYHIAIDKAREEKKGENKIGTTGRGIGPAYEDRAARCAVTISDLKDLDNLKIRLTSRLEEANLFLQHVLGSSVTVSIDEVLREVENASRILIPLASDVGKRIEESVKTDKSIIFEGAQATMLDVTHGTVPFVTSSACIAGGVLTGLGVGPSVIDHTYLVAKAYCTRVGAGPFPTELHDANGDKLREVGLEFGTVTGRPRRCGWFDAVALKKAITLNGVSLKNSGSVALTKIDVLSGFAELKVCVAYNLNGKEIDTVPTSINEFLACTPVYKTFPGWSEDITKVKNIKDLPANALNYIKGLEEILGVPVSLVSVGPERDALLSRS